MQTPESAFDSERTASKGCAFSLLDIVEAGLPQMPVIDDVSRHSILNDDPKNTLAKIKHRRATPAVLFILIFLKICFFILVCVFSLSMFFAQSVLFLQPGGFLQNIPRLQWKWDRP